MGEPGIFKTMFTESDNVTHDLYRYLAMVSIVVGLALQIYVVVWKEPSQPFDFQTFGIGVGVLFAGVGVAMKLKSETKAAALAVAQAGVTTTTTTKTEV